jgi:hypothetical protein
VKNYVVEVFTGDMMRAGTNANVYLVRNCYFKFALSNKKLTFHIL